jgi:ABC-type sugar transport system ATPase subunit
MHQVAGVFQPDSGAIELNGQSMIGRNEQATADAGIAMVFEERSLVGALSVAENIYARGQPANQFWRDQPERLARRRTAHPQRS